MYGIGFLEDRSSHVMFMSLQISKSFFFFEFLFDQKLKNLLIFKLVANIDEDEDDD